MNFIFLCLFIFKLNIKKPNNIFKLKKTRNLNNKLFVNNSESYKKSLYLSLMSH